MRTTRKFGAIAGGIVLTGGLLAGSAAAAGAAQAAPQAASDCPSGWFCVWSGQNYTGHMQKVAGNNADLTKYSVFQNFRSYYNHGKSCDFEGFSEKNYHGSSGVAPRGDKGSSSTPGWVKSNKWVNCG